MSAETNRGRATVERFYRCFAERDGAGMAACYAPDATFSDPVFTDLRGPEVGGMWRMLTARAQDFSVELTSLDGRGDHYTARWTARYLFSGTGRKVTNHVTSSITLRDGLILTQHDVFDLPAWLAQALGPVGSWLGHGLGWTGLPTRLVRTAARRGLDRYLRRHPG